MDVSAVESRFAGLARMGYVARGSVYLIVGGLAVLAAMGEGGETTDSKGALRELMSQPFGDLLLVFIIVGLFGYALWRLVQAVGDTDGHGKSGRGLAVRGGLLVSAATHALLAFWAIRLLAGSGGDGGGVGMLPGSGWGRLLSGLIGTAILVAGAAHVFKGWTARFERYLEMPAALATWFNPVCRFGLIARGIVLCIVGVFVMQSAWRAHFGELRGMEEALDALRSTAFGTWLLGVVAAGLFAFGLYSLIEAVYRRVDPALDRPHRPQAPR